MAETNIKKSIVLDIVSREYWKAAIPSKRPMTLYHPVQYIWFIYNIGTPSCQTKERCCRILNLQQARCMTGMKMSDIPFNFLIGGDGRIYEGRGWFYQPPAFKLFPDEGCDRIDIGYISNGTKDEVSYQMVRAALDLITFGLRENYIKDGYETKEWNRIGEPIGDDPAKPFGK